MDSELLIASFTALFTVTTLVIGKLLEILFIEPIKQLRGAIGKIAYTVTYLANVYPISHREIKEDNRKELEQAQQQLRELASELRSAAQIVPQHDLLAIANIIPSQQAIAEASTALIGWSNNVYETDDRQARHIFREQVIKALDIKYT